MSTPELPPVPPAATHNAWPPTADQGAPFASGPHVIDHDQPCRKCGYTLRGLTADEVADRVPADAQLLGVSCMFSQDWPYLKRVLRRLRERFPHIPIAAGGEHITAMPEVALADGLVDFCVLGEGEETLVELLDAIGSGRRMREVAGLVYRDGGQIVRNATRARVAEIDGLPLPAWDLFPIEAYLGGGYGFGVDRGRCMPVLATRGCPRAHHKPSWHGTDRCSSGRE